MTLERKRSSRRSNFRYQQAKKATAGGRCKACCRKFVAFMFSHVGLCALVVGYSVMGALVFKEVESKSEHEQELARNVTNNRVEMVKRMWVITDKLNVFHQDNWTQQIEEEIKEFQKSLIEAVKSGYSGRDLNSTRWSFSGAFLYSLTVITTIGYGNVAPRTALGKAVTIGYAIIGIPLMLLYLTNIGDGLAKSFKYMYGRLCRCGKRSPGRGVRRGVPSSATTPTAASLKSGENYRAHHVVGHSPPAPLAPPPPSSKHNAVVDKLRASTVGGAADDEVRIESIPEGLVHHHHHHGYPGHHHHHHHPDVASDGGGVGGGGATGGSTSGDEGEDEYGQPRVTVPIYLCLLILAVYIIGGGALFAYWENWNMLDGSYFCFVTLSTIGFGDLVPGSGTVSDDGSQDKLVLCSLYLLVGMALIAMCFSLMQSEVIAKVRSFGIRLGIIKAEDEDDD